MTNKPYSESCVQNREVILPVITPYLKNAGNLLEVGSGTGQHAIYFSPHFPDLIWQTSDLAENLPGIMAWIKDSNSKQLPEPIEFDVNQQWPDQTFDIVYTANTFHIMDINSVEICLRNLPNLINKNGYFIVYGPFNYKGQYTSASNQQFDQFLKARNSASGIKDFEKIVEHCQQMGINLIDDIEMPANNRILVFHREL